MTILFKAGTVSMLWLAVFGNCTKRVQGQDLSEKQVDDYGKRITDAANGEKIKKAVTANGGLYRMLTTADFGWLDGLEVDFQGRLEWCRIGRVQSPRNSAVVLLYEGPADKPAIHSAANGAIFDGVNLWRRLYSKTFPEWDGSVGFKFENPASATRIANGSIAGFDVGILLAKSNHTEHFLVENQHVHDCRVFFRNEENQAVGHKFQNIFQHHRCEVLFQFADVPDRNGGGGNFEANTVVILDNCLVFDIEKSNSNSCTFSIGNFKADNNAKGWKLIRQKKGPLNFTARGHIGENADPAPDAIDVADKSNLDIQLWWKGKMWPRDYRYEDGAWRSKP
jgi:hypothetical protein